MRNAVLLLAALLAVVHAGPVRAAPAEPPPGPLQRLDEAFGRWFVGPMASFFFYDLYRADNTLPPGEGIGAEVGDEVVTGWDGHAYIYQRKARVPRQQVQPAPLVPVDVAVGPVHLRVREDPDHPGALVGEAAPAELDPVALGLPVLGDGRPPGVPFTAWDGPPIHLPAGAPPAEELVVSTAFGQVPVVLRPGPGTWSVVPARVEVPPELVPLEEGLRVRVDGQPAAIRSLDDQQVEVLFEAKRADPAPLPNPDDVQVPLIVAWLVFGAIFFTLRMNFINLRGFRHAIHVTMGRYDDPNDPGEVSHFQALSAALSATVGLGNIAGVALAVAAGGPGAIFWMVVAGFLGMSSKFTECTLGQMYRKVDAAGRVLGGPMRYLRIGLEERGMGGLGRVLSVLFAVMCIGGSLGGGNMFQANQSYQAVAELVPLLADNAWLYGVVLAFLVGLVIIGGIKSIGAAASRIVPLMCGIYLLAGFWILIVHAADIPRAFGVIVREAFTPEAGMGGMIGVLMTGFRRAAFSNEAGIGSASIAHSAAATDEPVREGIVALLEPFIDTIVVCTMTGLVVVITGAYVNPVSDGVLMTSQAFGSVLDWFPVVLSIAVFLFAFSTMISWSYYGERCWTFLFGEGSSNVYRVIFLLFVFFGSVFKLGNVLDFSDLMVLGMAFPNIFGLLILSGKVRRALDDYWQRYRSGAFDEAA